MASVAVVVVESAAAIDCWCSVAWSLTPVAVAARVGVYMPVWPVTISGLTA